MKRLLASLILLAAFAVPVHAVTVSSASASMGGRPPLLLFPNESLTYSETGTFTGRIELQKSLDGVNFVPIGISTVNNAGGTFTGVVRNDQYQAYYRWLVSTVTAGSFVSVLYDNDDYVGQIVNLKNQPLVRMSDDTFAITGALTTSGDLTVSGNLKASSQVAVKTGGTQTVTAQTTSTITGLTIALAPNSTYQFEYVLFSSAAATTTGLALVVNHPTDATSTVGYEFSTGATTVGYQVGSNQSALITAASSAGTALTFNRVVGSVTTVSAGNLSIALASEVNASAVNVLPGSYGVVRY
jgi:hypothetical protein